MAPGRETNLNNTDRVSGYSVSRQQELTRNLLAAQLKEIRNGQGEASGVAQQAVANPLVLAAVDPGAEDQVQTVLIEKRDEGPVRFDINKRVWSPA